MLARRPENALLQRHAGPQAGESFCFSGMRFTRSEKHWIATSLRSSQ
jgi:hypothetical protein